ncbi:MAG: primosomal protein N', partial [Candidatus Gracilibacteria bacterium]|nr:primosomal protein N' [Candidatus Gracilibacteria bacterium]
MHYYHTLIKHLPQLLTYQSERAIPIGSLIRTQLGRKAVNGIVIQEITQPEFECVSIDEILILEALTTLHLDLCKWMSSYYFASLSRCIQLFLPSPIWNQKPKLKLDEQKIPLNPDNTHPSKAHHDQPLTTEQQQVLSIIFPNNPTQPHANPPIFPLLTPNSELRTSPTHFLLHGITGSGKTEIYLQLIKKSIQRGKQSLLLVPEIALTTELIQSFSEHFPNQISIIHSKRSDRERIQSWHRIHQGHTKLILGSRSALFTPWKDLDTIIMDEEHEWTYKQESSPRYHAKTVAEKIMQLRVENSEFREKEKPILLLGSATPSIESYFQATTLNSLLEPERPRSRWQPSTLNYQLLTLTHRANNSALPTVTIVDLREEYQKKNFSMFSEALQEAIKQRLEKKEQIILFLNKRGSSSSITCRDCGFTPKCENCDICLTFHAKLKDFQDGGLICHYCGSYQENHRTCPECHSAAIRHLGTGTQKAEEQLKQLFPEARVLRADKDTTGGKSDFEEIYHKMKDQKADILLGTQIIAKGLDLENITLTGILIADIGLHIPDFRASEHVFQLLT